jgi:hypothetical protein
LRRTERRNARESQRSPHHSSSKIPDQISQTNRSGRTLYHLDPLTMTRILFCGEAFPASRSALKQRLDTLQVSGELLEWPDAGVAALPDSIDVVIPLMKRIDAAVMDARPFRLIQQWGAGLERVDLEAA